MARAMTVSFLAAGDTNVRVMLWRVIPTLAPRPAKVWPALRTAALMSSICQSVLTAFVI